jgi:hypothetical protein
MASKEYLNAAFLSAEQEIEKLVTLLPDIPFVDERAVAMRELASERGRKMIYDIVRNAIAAGEAADAKKKST